MYRWLSCSLRSPLLSRLSVVHVRTPHPSIINQHTRSIQYIIRAPTRRLIRPHTPYTIHESYILIYTSIRTDLSPSLPSTSSPSPLQIKYRTYSRRPARRRRPPAVPPPLDGQARLHLGGAHARTAAITPHPSTTPVPLPYRPYPAPNRLFVSHGCWLVSALILLACFLFLLPPCVRVLPLLRVARLCAMRFGPSVCVTFRPSCVWAIVVASTP
ncbi:hypothetical protein PYCCODRAFT_912878 [Trametes coccinea BRFM310]|uniref:Uncharacterized protein n=1 Tax=Trametes coccinea (strain BRFM310) TaxID=1353009 RepID=A0A1Y2ICF1_TRAC3|nr:hypothetical protein PYCCODRAFT_912878 [Trametes coccinea BRFM310]